MLKRKILSQWIIVPLILLLGLCGFMASPAYAGNAPSTYVLVQCDSSGVVTNNTAITGVNLPITFDTSGNFYVNSVDVAIFTGSTLVKELDGFTSTNLHIGLGGVTNYDYDAATPVVYGIKFRVHYGVVGQGAQDITEDWQRSGLYFEVVPASSPTHSSNTGIQVNNGGSSVVTGVDNTSGSLSVTVVNSTTAGTLKSDITSTDGSAQAYAVTTSSGEPVNDSTALVTGNKLTVTAADNSTTATYIVTVAAVNTAPIQLATRSGISWDGSTPGKAEWNAVSNASGYSVQLEKGGNNQGSAVSVGAGTEYYNFTTDITTAGSGSYTFTVTAVGDGTNYSDSAESVASSVYNYTAPAVQLTTPSGLSWDGNMPGKAEWNAVSNASGYSVQLKNGGTNQGSAVSVGAGTESYNFTTEIAAAGSGGYTFTVTAVGDGTNYSDSAESVASSVYNYVAQTAPPFVAVTGITGVPTTATVGTQLPLTGTVNPSDATNQNIIWSVNNNASTTEATISGNANTLSATGAGTVVVTATIVDGATATTNYTQDFNITVTAPPPTACTVTFNSNGGSEVASQTVNYNNAAAKPSDPTKTGYTFVGWYTDSALTKAFDFGTPITGDITLYAMWSANICTVTFNSNGGSEVANQAVNYNNTAAQPSDPTRPDYVFAGWYTDSGLNTPFDFGTKITGNITLYARWSPPWQTVGSAGFSAGGAHYTSIAIDSSGTPYAVYQDEGNSYKATVMKYAEGSWQTVGNAGFSADKANYTSMAIDSSGTPYVVYSDVGNSGYGGNSGNATVKKMMFNSGTDGGTIPINDGNKNLTVGADGTTVAFTPDTLATVGSSLVSLTVTNGVHGTRLDLWGISQPTPSGGMLSSPLPQTSVSSALKLGGSIATPVNVLVQISEGTTVSAPPGSGWDGTINTPTVQSVDSVAAPNKNGAIAQVDSVIEIGFGDVPLTFSHAVRIRIPGQAGKKVGYVRNGIFYPITTVLSADDQSTADSTLGPGQDGYINVGPDLVIWTKHFTKFVTYTETPADNGGGHSNGGGGGSYSPPSTSTTVTGSVLNGSNGAQVSSFTATVTTDSNGNSTVSMQAADVVALKGPDGTSGSMFGDLSHLALTSNGGSPITLGADGTLSIGNLAKGTDNTYDIVYDLGSGQKIAIGTMEVKIDSSGNVTLTVTLIDPYGIITDAATGKALAGVKVTLYYADTARNKTAGKTPDTVVTLPGITGFKPNNNQDPQTSDVNGAYGFMVFPNTDYYIAASKDGYDQYTSPTISVDKEIVHWDFKMSPTTSGVTRLAGQSRVDTALAIAKAEYSGKVANVVLATADNYPDALAGSVLAYKLKAPILLVGSSGADQEKVLDYMKANLDPSGNVYILGGTAVVSADMQTQIQDEGFQNITRLGGTDRYATSVQIAEAEGVASGTPVVLVSGENYPDALSVSSAAAVNQYPVLLVSKDGISDLVKQEIAKINPSKVYIIGLEGVISKAVEDQIVQTINIDKSNIVRIGGADRFATSLAVDKYFNLQGNIACVATGNDFPDALAGSVYAASHEAPILLVDKSLTDEQIAYLKASKAAGATIFGGEGAVSSEITGQLSEIFGQ
ncbi:N-acetylmuramoyl-L-alanine amidase LytC precursor [Peptococcaceae bacterium CEB3]|nr:N-acetylmuramoyl-L-alanine amidase LytC precursor [Peptococcaceae bacterium CEB3]